MESSPIVCNAGPLIALAFVDQLQLLPALYQRVLVPEAVWREVVDSGFGRAGALGLARRAVLVLIDELLARRVASQVYGLRVKGSAGILVQARKAGMIPEVRPLLDAMKKRGYYLSERLIERACREAM